MEDLGFVIPEEKQPKNKEIEEMEILLAAASDKGWRTGLLVGFVCGFILASLCLILI